MMLMLMEILVRGRTGPAHVFIDARAAMAAVLILLVFVGFPSNTPRAGTVLENPTVR